MDHGCPPAFCFFSPSLFTEVIQVQRVGRRTLYTHIRWRGTYTRSPTRSNARSDDEPTGAGVLDNFNNASAKRREDCVTSWSPIPLLCANTCLVCAPSWNLPNNIWPERNCLHRFVSFLTNCYAFLFSLLSKVHITIMMTIREHYGAIISPWSRVGRPFSRSISISFTAARVSLNNSKFRKTLFRSQTTTMAVINKTYTWYV